VKQQSAGSRQLKDMFDDIRKLDSEKDRLTKTGKITANRYRKKKYDWEEIIEDRFKEAQ